MGIEGEFIELEEGEQVHINHLTSEQKKFLKDNFGGQASNKTELADEDFLAIQEAYQDGNIEGVVQLLQENGYSIGESSEEYHTDVDYLTDDEIYIMDLQSKYPSLTDQELFEQLNQARQSRAFSKMVDNLRENLRDEEIQRIEREYEDQLNEDRREIKQSIQSMESIFGYENNSELMNELLPYATTLSEDGEHSVFIDHLLANPEEQYKHIFLAMYADELIGNVDRIKQEAYEEGRKSILKSFPKSTKKGNKINTNKSTQKGRGVIDLDDLII
jgi:hypothetical protein